MRCNTQKTHCLYHHRKGKLLRVKVIFEAKHYTICGTKRSYFAIKWCELNFTQNTANGRTTSLLQNKIFTKKKKMKIWKK